MGRCGGIPATAQTQRRRSRCRTARAAQRSTARAGARSAQRRSWRPRGWGKRASGAGEGAVGGNDPGAPWLFPRTPALLIRLRDLLVLPVEGKDDLLLVQL